MSRQITWTVGLGKIVAEQQASPQTEYHRDPRASINPTIRIALVCY